MHRTTTAILLLVLAAPMWIHSWDFAPGTASANPQTLNHDNFQNLDGFSNLEGLLVENEGWYWLKVQVPVQSDDEAFLINGTSLAWKLYLDNDLRTQSGSGPPLWYPSSPIPKISLLPENQLDPMVLLFKVYLRQGYTSLPGPVETGTLDNLRHRQFIISIKELGIPLLSVVLGMMLFIGGIAAYFTHRDSSDLNLAFFGFFSAMVFIEPVLSIIPGIPKLIPWIIPALLIRAALPLAISFWRKSISSIGGRDSLLFTLFDLILSISILIWMIIPLAGYPFIPINIQPVFNFNPLPWYILLSITAALFSWLYHTLSRHPGRIQSLLLLLSAITPAIVMLSAGKSLEHLSTIFIESGFPLTLAIAIPVMIGRKNKLPIYETVESIETLKPLENPDIMKRSLRSSLFPSSIPWDQFWDLASVRQGTSLPATGFHDIYQKDNSHLAGFSFMDTGSDSLESLIYIHQIQNEISRNFNKSNSLPETLKSIRDEIIMTGTVGRFQTDKLELLSLSKPPVLIKRQGNNKVMALPGSTTGLENTIPEKFLNIRMSRGDTLIFYTPSILDLKNSAGEKMGIGRFSRTFNAAASGKAKEIAAGIVRLILLFSGSEKISAPFQLLVIKHR